ncbi:hypothetical protein PG984_006639 [Apiospora sp. TS-2023a]
MDAIEIERAQSIAHLYMLEPYSSQRRDNPRTNTPISEAYTLSFEDEEVLASLLAFLSSNTTSEEAAHVTAVCIKENRPPCLDVLLAVNKGHPDDGESVLREVKGSFVELFKTLRQNASPYSMDGQDIIFDTILSMCRIRILRRLETKTPIKKMLRRARKAIEADKKSPYFARFLTEAGKLESAIDEWLAVGSDSALKTLVQRFSELQELEKDRTLTHFKKGVRDTSKFRLDMKKCLLDTIKKIARYKSCVQDLCGLWEKYPLFRQVNVVPVRLPPEAFSRTIVKHLEPNLASKISSRITEHLKAIA